MTTETAPMTRLSRVHRHYDVRPIGLLLTIFSVLAVLRLTGAFQAWAMVLSIALTPLALIVVPREAWAEVGVRRVSSRRQLMQGVGAVIGAYVVTALVCLAVLGRGSNDWISLLPNLFRSMFPGSPILAITAMFVSMGLLVPLAEEVFYRGVLHRAVSQKLAVVPTVLVISAGWALVHIGDYGLVPFDPQVLAGMLPSVFVMGLALGYCREVTSSVVGSTIAQGTANVLFTLWALWL